MDITKGFKQNLAKFVVYVFIFLLPFGQLLRLELNFGGRIIPILGVDIVVGLSTLFLPSLKKLPTYYFFKNFFWLSLFSLFLSLLLFDPKTLAYGSLYLLRLFSYFSFFLFTWNLVKETSFESRVLDMLLIPLTFAAFLGWIQYFWFPDLTSLKYIGWDDHLGRLIGTYLDPGFTGLVLVLGFFLSLFSYLKGKNKGYLLVSIFFLMSIAFTYSRAAYLALLSGTFIAGYFERKLIVWFFVVILLLILPILPKSEGEGVKLEGTASIEARVINYRETLGIFSLNPLFGVGFNNICAYRVSSFGDDPYSNACGGADSSFLFVLATTGVVGFSSFWYLSIKLFESLEKGEWGNLARVGIVSVGMGSFFANALFYPFILGVMTILLATGTKE